MERDKWLQRLSIISAWMSGESLTSAAPGLKYRISQLSETFGRNSRKPFSETTPQLSLGQIYNAIAHYCDHQAEIDSEIAEEERLAESLRPKQTLTSMRQKLMERILKQETSEPTS